MSNKDMYVVVVVVEVIIIIPRGSKSDQKKL